MSTVANSQICMNYGIFYGIRRRLYRYQTIILSRWQMWSENRKSFCKRLFKILLQYLF
jgi:hypothetical protein